MEALYEACGSERKEIHIMEGKAHGTDMVTIPPEGELGYASFPETDREREDREELAGELMRFVREAFGEEPDIRLPEAAQGNHDAQALAEGGWEEHTARLARRLQETCAGAIRSIPRQFFG